jgi:AAA domain
MRGDYCFEPLPDLPPLPEDERRGPGWWRENPGEADGAGAGREEVQKARRPDAESQKPPPELPYFAASIFADRPVPPRSWHVKGVIPGRTVTLLFGDGGTGKSLLAKQLLASTALGLPWLGLSVEPGPCLFITAEDDRDEIHRRLFDIAAHLGADFAKLDGLHLVTLAGEDALFAVPDGRSGIVRPTPLFGALERTMAAINPRIVVLDTLADVFGGEEHLRAQARQFIGMLRGIAGRPIPF